MNDTHLDGLASSKLTDLTLIAPYDPDGGVIAGILPLDGAARRSAVAGGYHVVAAVDQHPPYTHVVSAGGQTYLATLVPAAVAPPAGDDAGTVPSPIEMATPDPEGREQAWESEGGALAGGAYAGVTGDATPPPGPVRLVAAGVDLGGDRPMTGTITDLRPGGFGFIATDAWGTPWHLPFRRWAVDDDGFDDLYVGQRVRFDQALVPGTAHRQHAIGVVPLN